MDPVATAGLVTREVRSGERDGVPTRIAIARREYPTDRADLWNAVTDPARIARWFSPVTGDLREGGRYQVEGNAGGVVERCDAPSGFGLTWEMMGQASWVVVTLTETVSGTAFELAHEAPVDPDFWQQFGPGAVGVGWDLALMGLGLYFETGGVDITPGFADAWSVSEEGRLFVGTAAAGWADAAIADGDDQSAARAAADRTLAFYTTIPDQGASE